MIDNQKTLHFISGLPRSGSTLITNLFKQNPDIHGESVSSLASLVGSVNSSWNQYETNKEYVNDKAKAGTIRGMLSGYHAHADKPIIMDKDRGWIPLIGVVEEVLQRKAKVIACVRNPAEILSSFERLRRENPLYFTQVDAALREGSNISSRAFYYAGPDGALGLSHRNLKDAITLGHLDRILFVDYNRFCSTPKAQMKRIYEFLELPNYEHDFENIVQEEVYNDLANGLPNLHKIKPSLDKTTINCVDYLGLELYEQYNREIFWNAWI
jgi:sulfotransferase